MSTKEGRVRVGKVISGDYTLAGCQSVLRRVQKALPLPWSPQERRDLEAISAASLPALKQAAIKVAEAAARKRHREDAASDAMESISHAVVHGGSEESRRAAFVHELRARLSASLPLVKDKEQRLPTLTPEVFLQATSDMIESLGLNLLPVSKRAAPSKESRVQTVAVLQRTFKNSTELDSLFGPRWYIEYSGRLMLIFCPPIHVEVVRTTVESRRHSYIVGKDGGHFTDMEVLSSASFVDLRIRMRYVALFHDLIPEVDQQRIIDRYVRESPPRAGHNCST